MREIQLSVQERRRMKSHYKNSVIFVTLFAVGVSLFFGWAIVRAISHGIYGDGTVSWIATRILGILICLAGIIGMIALVRFGKRNNENRRQKIDAWQTKFYLVGDVKIKKSRVERGVDYVCYFENAIARDSGNRTMKAYFMKEKHYKYIAKNLSAPVLIILCTDDCLALSYDLFRQAKRGLG